MADFTFDRKALRYRKADGKFLSKRDMLDLLDQANAKDSKAIQDETDRLIAESIPLNDWLNSVAQKLKTAHIQQYLLGRGGEAMLTDADYDTLTDRVRSEFKYLKGFAEAIDRGNLSDAQIKARMQLYINAAGQTRKMAERNGHAEAGNQEERRVLAQVKHCASCLAYAGKGWVPIGTLPSIGTECECGPNCRCSFEYRVSPPKNPRTLSAGTPRYSLNVVNKQWPVVSIDSGFH
jgi:hypothetical protein